MTICEKIKVLEGRLASFKSENPLHLLVVSKAQSLSSIKQVIDAGHYRFGENYVQEAVQKIEELNKEYKNLEWHYIGRIQANKIKLMAYYFDWVQTLTDEKYAKKLNDQCKKINKTLFVCIQVNISSESQKNGVELDSVFKLAQYISKNCPFLVLKGLMTISLLTEDEAVLNNMFSIMKETYDALRLSYDSIDTLSMGMSHDMNVAIHHGANMLRIGRAIFGERR